MLYDIRISGHIWRKIKFCDNLIRHMKKFLPLIIVFLVFIAQIQFKEENVVMTLHSAPERKLLAELSKKYEVLPGFYNPTIKMTNKAIYTVAVSKNEKRYIVFARDIDTKADSILMYDTKTHELKGKVTLVPLRISNSINEKREILDIDGDRNLEVLVPTLDSSSEKGIKIFRINKDSFSEVKVNILPGYTEIDVNDIDLDGKYELICFRDMNGVPMLPHIFKWENGEYKLIDAINYPKIIEDNLKKLSIFEKKGIESGNNLLLLDVYLSRAYTYLKKKDYQRFGDYIDKIQSFSNTVDAGIKLRIYKSKVYLGYLYLDRNDPETGYDYLKDASTYMYPVNDQNRVESMIYAELAGYLIDKYEFKKAKESLEISLKFYPDNMIAKNYLSVVENF